MILFVLSIVAFIALGMLRRAIPSFDTFLARLVAETSSGSGPETRDERSWLYLWSGMAAVLSALVYLELRWPYYFVQDDVLVTEFPGILFGCRSVWSGKIPDYIPNVFMGSPTGGGLLYPDYFLAYAIARYLLRDEYATMEVFAILHIVPGFIATFFLCRRIGISPLYSCLGSLSFVLSGGILVMGRSWHSCLTIVLWLPLSILSTVRLMQNRASLVHILWASLCIALWYYVAFPEYWCYGMAFSGIAVLWSVITRQAPVRRILTAFCAFVIGIGLSLPLFIVQLELTKHIAQGGGYGGGIARGLAAMLLPFPFVKAPHPNNWGALDAELAGTLYYIGPIFVLFSLAAAFAWLTRPRRDSAFGQLWTLSAVVAFLLCLGPDFPLWGLLSRLPVFKSINNHPFRLLPFLALFAVLSGGSALSRFSERISFRRSIEIAIATFTLGLLCLHVWSANFSFFSYGFRPYPTLPEDLKAALQVPPPPGTSAARVLPVARMRSVAPDYAFSLMLGLPVVYNTLSFDGYDPVAERSPLVRFARFQLLRNPLETLRAYGVRWILMHASVYDPLVAAPGSRPIEAHVRFALAFHSIRNLMRPVLLTDRYAVWELTDVAPLAFPLSIRSKSLPLQAHGQGLDIDMASFPAGGNIVVNFFWYPAMQAFADGKKIAIRPDRWNRIVASVPARTHTLRIRYYPGWMRVCSYGAIVSLIGLVLALVTIRLERKREVA